MTPDAPRDDPAAPAPAPAPPRRRLGRSIALGVVAVLLLGVLAVGAAVGWLIGTASGSAWLLARIPGVQVEAPRGALAGAFDARRVVVALPGGTDTVTLTDLAWRGLSLQRAEGDLWARLAIDAVSAARIDVVLAPKPPTPSTPPKAPTDLKLPIELELKSLKVGDIHATPLGDTVVGGLDAALHLGASGGRVHRIDHLAVRVAQIAIGAKAQIAAAAPMALEASVDASQAAAGTLPAWTAALRLAGPLAEPVLDAVLRATPVARVAAAGAGQSATAGAGARAGTASAAPPAAQSAEIHAGLRPFAPWPLGDLTARARAFDLSAFVATAPATALDIDALATRSGTERPAVVTLDVANPAAGRYDAARLPFQSVHAEIAVTPEQATEIEVRAASAVLGSAREPGGRISAQGRWSPSRWTVDAVVDSLQAKHLDGRAPALLISGPVHAAGSAAAADGRGIDLKTTLSGRLDDAGRARPVALDLDTSVDLAAADKRLRLARLVASAGSARLQAAGTATQADPTAPWVVKADASLADFDPGVWLAGLEASPWRGTRNRVDARLAVDASAALPAAGAPALDALAEARGKATLAIGDGSLLAGVPLGGNAAVDSDGRNARVRADVAAAGNTLHLDGRVATRGQGGTDVDLALDARTLATLAPIYRLFQPAGADARLAGRVTAQAHVDGRWPRVTTRGDIDAQALQVGALSLQRAAGRWTAGTAATDRVALDLTVDDLKTQPAGGPPGPSLSSVVVGLTGTARAHALDLRVTSRARPPAWAEAAADSAAPAAATPSVDSGSGSGAGPTTGSGSGRTAAPSAAVSSGRAGPPTRLTVATMHAAGGLVDQRGAALSGWRGTVQSIDVSSGDGRSAPLLRARDLALETFWGGGPVRVDVQPGRLEMLGGGVRWRRLGYTAAAPGAALPRIDVDATIDPLRIAPLLAQAQPSFGWGGDLAIGGRVRLRTADAGVEADALVERSGGDLSITDELATHRLGLTELRVSLKVDRGVWSASTRLVGQSLGTATADATIRTSPLALVPPADAPIDGRVDLDIADLAGFGNWVPPGWRIGGALQAHATLGGRVGRPDYRGEVVGRGITARNFLEGVSATDGDLLVRLAGTTATIDHFTAKGGDGTLRITGDATFDTAPAIRLDVTATRFQVLGRIDRKIVASGHAGVAVDPQRIKVSGQFGVDQGLIDITRSDAPRLADDVTVVRAAGVLSPAAAASAAESPGSNAPVPVAVATTPTPEPAATVRVIDLDLKLDLGSQLAIRGHGLAARLAGELAVTSPDSKVALNGTVNVVDGTFKAYGQDLVIDRGAIVFSGPIDRPRLDIEATRPKLENIRVGVTITGSVANPRIRLFSEPEMSEVDKLSYLVVGRGSDDLGRNESALLQSAAMALVSGEGNGEPGITERVTKALGLDELSIGQTDGTVKQTVVNLGKQLSDRWSIGYQAGLNAAAGSVQLIYKVAKRLTVRAQAGTASSLDLIWSWRWQ